MSVKSRKVPWILVIATLGIAYLFIKRKAKEISSTPSNEIKYSNKIKFDTSKFIKKLGGKENISSVNATLNTLKITLNDPSTVDKNSLDEFGIKGFMKNNNTLTLIFGDNAIAIKESMGF